MVMQPKRRSQRTKSNQPQIVSGHLHAPEPDPEEPGADVLPQRRRQVMRRQLWRRKTGLTTFAGIHFFPLMMSNLDTCKVPNFQHLVTDTSATRLAKVTC